MEKTREARKKETALVRRLNHSWGLQHHCTFWSAKEKGKRKKKRTRKRRNEEEESKVKLYDFRKEMLHQDNTSYRLFGHCVLAFQHLGTGSVQGRIIGGQGRVEVRSILSRGSGPVGDPAWGSHLKWRTVHKPILQTTRVGQRSRHCAMTFCRPLYQNYLWTGLRMW